MKMFKKAQYYVCTLLLMSLSVGIANAKTYRWVDADGKVHYSDNKPNVASKEILLPKSSYLPEVAIQKAIPYDGVIQPQTVTLATLELKLVGANYRDIKVGNVYSGATCQKKESDLVWTEGNGFLDDTQLSQAVVSEFNRLGYSVVYENATSNIQPDNRLILKTQLSDLKINRCVDKQTYRTESRDDAYVKIKWVLFDQLARKTLYEGSSEGVYKGMTELARAKGTAQSVDRAMLVAVNNVLSDSVFVKLLGETYQSVGEQRNFKSIPVNLKYTTDSMPFKSKVDQDQLRQSTVTVRTTQGHGSGVLISDDGYILTNAHVVGNAYQVIVILNEQELEATVERIEPIRDVALLKLSRMTATVQSLISVASPGVGDALFVIGTPLSEDLSHTVTRGILSAKRNRDGLAFYQTDAAINHGNSGGPIYNDAGGLVAISVSGILTKAGAGLGLNYLIPIGDALSALNISRQDTSAEVDMGDKQDILIATDDEALFRLYQGGLRAKQQGQFALAEDKLRQAVALLATSDSSEQASEIRDTYYFSLPIAQAKQAIADSQPEKVRGMLIPVRAYVVNHPKRFMLMKEIADIEESAKYLGQAQSQSRHVQGQNELAEVKIFMSTYYAENGVLPSSKVAVIALLSKHLGRRIFNRYVLLEYTADRDGFSMIFRHVEQKNEVRISTDF